VANQALGRFLWHIRQLHGASEDSDAQLLERFTSRREEEAFVALVRRHGPLVLGVCRRVLRDDHESEDAFQATFLALARQAGSIRRGESLSSWLYGVALRVALRSRAQLTRRSRHERTAAAQKANGASADGDAFPADLRLVLDEELARLPARYRRALVLCYLQGRTHIEAARELGYPAGSMSRHLARARELLQGRLIRRGVAPSAALLGAELTSLTSRAALPSALVNGTVRTCATFAIYPGASTAIPAKVLALADGALKSMLIANLKIAAAVLVAFCALGTGAGVLWNRAAPTGTLNDEQAPLSVEKSKPREEQAPLQKAKPAQKAPAPKQEAEPPPPADASSAWERRLAELRDILDKPVSVEFDKVPLADAMSYLQERYGFPIVYDREAFKDEVELQEFRKNIVQAEKVSGVDLRSVFRQVLCQVQADYRLRDTGVFIFPMEYVTSGRLLQQPVLVSFRQTSLDRALARVAAQSGVNIVLDARVARDAKVAITADLDNAPLETAVRILSDMAALKPVAMGNTLYVTTAANACKLEAERKASAPQPPTSAPKKPKEEAPKSGAPGT
jgi:RNA polymerase sigma-70 factor (ECF subfamily)